METILGTYTYEDYGFPITAAYNLKTFVEAVMNAESRTVEILETSRPNSGEFKKLTLTFSTTILEFIFPQ